MACFIDVMDFSRQESMPVRRFLNIDTVVTIDGDPDRNGNHGVYLTSGYILVSCRDANRILNAAK